jgi:hypothetical protein
MLLITTSTGIAYRERCVPFARLLFSRNDPFRLVAEVDKSSALGNPHNLAFDQVASVIHGLFLFEPLEDRAEVNFAALLFLNRRCGWFCHAAWFCAFHRCRCCFGYRLDRRSRCRFGAV